MTQRKLRSFIYSIILHVILGLLVISLVLLVGGEKKIKEKRHVIVLSHVHKVLPDTKALKPSAVVKKKSAPPKKKHVKKAVKKSPKKRKVIPKKHPKKKVVTKKLPKTVAKIIQKEPQKKVEVLDKVVEEAPRALVVTPHESVTLSPTAKAKVQEPITSKSTPEEVYVNTNINEIMSLLRKYLYYPRMARKRHIQGRVMVRFELLKNGDIRNIEVLSSQRETLAKAAVKTIERLKGKFPLPSKNLILHVPIMYQLK